MLDDKVVLSFRDLMEAELRSRDQPMRLQAQGADRKHGLGGNAMHARAEIGCAELSTRVEIIWRGIKRCYATYQVSAADESTISAINQQVQYWIRGECNVIRSLIDVSWGPMQARTQILGMVENRRDELIKKYQNEARFYVHELMNPPKKPEQTNTINVQNNYGAIAAGSDAQARVEIAGNVQLIQALEQLRTVFQHANAMPSDQRGDSLGVVDEAIIAVRQSKPNKLKLLGLLKGVSVAVSLLADAPDAWDSVRSAASLLGIDLP